MAAGLPGRLLLPEHWAELFDGLDRGLAGVQGLELALRRRRRVDPQDGPARRAGAARDRGGARVLAGALWNAGAPGRRPRGAAPALRDRRGGEGPRACRCCAGSCCSCSWRRGCGSRGSTQREAWIAAAVVIGVGVVTLPVAAALDARPRLVGLPRLGLVRRRRGDHVRLEPRVRPARLVALRGDDAEREVRPAALLEGRDASTGSTGCAGSAPATSTRSGPASSSPSTARP